MRDVVSTVMEKEGMEYGDACRMLEKKYNLAVWKEYEENKIEDKPYEMGEEIDWEKRVTNRLKSMTRDKLVELDVVLKFWEVYDIIMVNNRGDVSKWKNLFSKLESIK